jgi:hypothetical protein
VQKHIEEILNNAKDMPFPLIKKIRRGCLIAEALTKNLTVDFFLRYYPEAQAKMSICKLSTK